MKALAGNNTHLTTTCVTNHNCTGSGSILLVSLARNFVGSCVCIIPSQLTVVVLVSQVVTLAGEHACAIDQ